jgi:hypothetical protein
MLKGELIFRIRAFPSLCVLVNDAHSSCTGIRKISNIAQAVFIDFDNHGNTTLRTSKAHSNHQPHQAHHHSHTTASPTHSQMHYTHPLMQT